MMTEVEYRAYDAINYSTLSQLDKDPKYVNSPKEATQAMLEGSALDTLMFNEQNFYNLFYVADESIKVSDALKAVLEEINAVLPNNNLDDEAIRPKVISIAHANNYYNAIKKEDTFYKKIVNPASIAYVKALQESVGKTIISYELFIWLKTAKEMLLTNSFTKSYFNSTNADIKVQFQVPIIWYSDENECKSLLDILIVNDKAKWAIPVDLKKSGDTNFIGSFFKFKYLIQASMYYDAVKYKYPDYTVHTPRYIAAFLTDVNRPRVYNIDEKLLEIGKNGGILSSGREINGYKQLILDLKWHREADLWEYPREYYENLHYNIKA